MPTTGTRVLPQRGDAVTLTLTPRKHPSSPLHLNFVVGAHQVCAFLETCLPCLHETCEVVHPATGIVYEVRVEHVTRGDGTKKEEEVIKAGVCRQKANSLFREANGKYKQVRKAIVEYNKALGWLRMGCEDHDGKRKDMEIGCRNNLAICYFKIENWIACVAMCEAVLKLDGKNKKALYRRGLAMAKLDWGVRGLSDLRKVRELEMEEEEEEEGKGVSGKVEEWEKECKRVLGKRRKQFAEVYNVMLQSDVFDNPIP